MSSAGPFERLAPSLQYHIVNTLGWRGLRPLQEASIESVLDGEHAVMLAPTAGGKTEAAMFPVLSRMLGEGWAGPSVLYVCPITALLNNLLPRLESYAGWVGRRAALWHGDVGAGDKRRIIADPPDILLTTPESLEVILVARREHAPGFFANVRVAIIDETHAFAGDDRGWHLLSVLERISRLAGREVQRLALSATVGNPEALLEWLAGSCEAARRVIAPVDAGAAEIDLELDYVGGLANAAEVISRLHRGEKRLVFCDSRARVEHLASELRKRKVTTFVSHGSLGVDERRQAERAFSERSDCVIVATSTLELGIDVGGLDRVIQIDAPSTVSGFLQRLGRTGRRPGTKRNCLFLATSANAFAHAAGLLKLWGDGYVEPVEPPPVPFHIFAQQVMALVLQTGGMARGDWRGWLGRMPGFAALTEEDVEAVLEHMLASEILFEDGGLLWLGPGGENEYGFRNFMELFTVFTSPPLFRVMHGRQELGAVHPISFASREGKPVVLLLAGRSWKLRHLDWAKKLAYVEPTADSGRSRWLGSSLGHSLRLCRAVRAVLGGETPPVRLTGRGKQTLAEIREDFAWLPPDGTALVRIGDRSRWWTFGGLLANASLASIVGGEPDNHSIRFAGRVTVDELTERLARFGASGAGSPQSALLEQALEQLKFAKCVPPELAFRTVRERLVPTGDARRVAAESVAPITVAE